MCAAVAWENTQDFLGVSALNDIWTLSNNELLDSGILDDSSKKGQQIMVSFRCRAYGFEDIYPRLAEDTRVCSTRICKIFIFLRPGWVNPPQIFILVCISRG